MLVHVGFLLKVKASKNSNKFVYRPRLAHLAPNRVKYIMFSNQTFKNVDGALHKVMNKNIKSDIMLVNLQIDQKLI